MLIEFDVLPPCECKHRGARLIILPSGSVNRVVLLFSAPLKPRPQALYKSDYCCYYYYGPTTFQKCEVHILLSI